MTSNIEAVIFDFDGVFVDSYSLVWKAYNNMCRSLRLGEFSTIDEFRRFYSVHFTENYERLGLFREKARQAQKLVDDYMIAMYHEARFFDGILFVAEAIQRPIGIASSALKTAIEKKLLPTGLLGKFRCIIGSEETGVENIKPSPVPLLMCAEGMGADITRCAYVGDTHVDVIAGRAAGVAKVIAVLSDYSGLELNAAARPDVITSRIGILAEI